MVNKSFKDMAIISGFPDFWQNAFPQATCRADDEVLDLPEAGFDLILHAMALHWANDPVGQLIQSRRALRPDGLLLAVLLGGKTLHELRASLAEAEAEVSGGLSPRIAPMGEVRDLGALLQRAGFALPVADSIPLKVSYKSPRHLMHDLRAMGETNALSGRPRKMTGRALMTRAEEIYSQAFGDAGRVNATFELIILTGWSPDDSQQKPLRPGSATTRLAQALGTHEAKLKD
ncbi:SAM-dependent methyltransferase, BioC-like [hydrothermal vent metagenome]|uniref:SAM-dependent methyltransferase, BioC-like n=1 Tax=hydrothermal vent metagenome TaxID=652676 RepID=A0A3B0SD90_9ZZZZ